MVCHIGRALANDEDYCLNNKKHHLHSSLLHALIGGLHVLEQKGLQLPASMQLSKHVRSGHRSIPQQSDPSRLHSTAQHRHITDASQHSTAQPSPDTVISLSLHCLLHVDISLFR